MELDFRDSWIKGPLPPGLFLSGISLLYMSLILLDWLSHIMADMATSMLQTLLIAFGLRGTRSCPGRGFDWQAYITS